MAIRVSLTDAEQCIRSRTPFVSASGNLRGYDPRESDSLNIRSLDNTQRRSILRATFVVDSYDTPIAWWSKRSGWHCPEKPYGPVTSNHRAVAHRAITHQQAA